jgi:hypothetical protein
MSKREKEMKGRTLSAYWGLFDVLVCSAFAAVSFLVPAPYKALLDFSLSQQFLVGLATVLFGLVTIDNDPLNSCRCLRRVNPNILANLLKLRAMSEEL